MGRRTARKITLKDKIRRGQTQHEQEDLDDSRHIAAIGRISGGVSVTYVPFRSMPTSDQICGAAIRKVIRALK